jgi:adenosylcobyric acid synthase
MDIPLPSEDSLSLGDKKSQNREVRIGILRHPRISNFTDFELLERYTAVEYIPYGTPLDGYDCIILPGTKNTIEDLKLLIFSGTAEALHRARQKQVPIIGICGGYQMLGCQIIDNGGIESESGIYPGLGLLDGITRFEQYEKCTTRVARRASWIPPILSEIGEVSGYEIHMGLTSRGKDPEAFQGDGAATADGLVFGTYMHGLFTNLSAIDALLSYLYKKKGLAFTRAGEGSRRDPYDELASEFEKHVDIRRIISLCTAGILQGCP